jgi:hypothetical protein
VDGLQRGKSTAQHVAESHDGRWQQTAAQQRNASQETAGWESWMACREARAQQFRHNHSICSHSKCGRVEEHWKSMKRWWWQCKRPTSHHIIRQYSYYQLAVHCSVEPHHNSTERYSQPLSDAKQSTSAQQTPEAAHRRHTPAFHKRHTHTHTLTHTHTHTCSK